MLKSIMNLLCVACLTLSLLSCKNTSGIDRIWAVGDGEKIKRDDIQNPLATDKNNTLWKDNTVNLFGARNEIIAFQLIIQADSSGAKGINVNISDLNNGESKIPGSSSGPADPFDYRGRYVELFTEHYLNIEKRTPPLWFYSKSATPSVYYTGWVPDCLIPFAAAPGKGGAPFNIEPGYNQGIWVDILIPKDAVAGIFTGKASVTVSGKRFKDIPIFLKVFDFTLPDSTHIKNLFGYNSEPVALRHGIKDGSKEYFDLEWKYFQLAHRHRFDLISRITNLDDMTNHYKGYLSGEIYSSGYKYAGPGENIGNTTFSIGRGGGVPREYGSKPKLMTESKWWAASDAWKEWFNKNAPGVELHRFLYPDEPDAKGPEGAKGIAATDTVIMQAKWSHSNPGIGREISTIVTTPIKPKLLGHVDFWSVASHQATKFGNYEEFASEKAKGHQYGIYNGFRPGMGAVVIDADGIEFRVMPWIIWKYKIDQYQYWRVNNWGRVNVFANPLTFRNMVNGDGTFLYPGQDKLFIEEDRNLAGPLSSIRAKNWRRGAQDYEYLWLAKQAGLETEMKEIVDKCVPTALWDAKDQENISWSSRGYNFDLYRKQLAELITSKKSGR